MELLWIKYIYNNKSLSLDKDNFYIFLENIKIMNCELILLTARDISTSLLTMKHLESCGFDIHLSRIFYNKNKGEELERIMTTMFPNIQNILFVDDYKENLINNDELSKYNLELYKIKYTL